MTKMREFTFPKKEKLKSRALIKTLFEEGKTLKDYPILIRYLKIEHKINQVGVSVSKRSFKKAVDRIGIKRQMREAYRLNKTNLVSETEHYALMIIYIGHDKSDSRIVHTKVKTLLKALT